MGVATPLNFTGLRGAERDRLLGAVAHFAVDVHSPQPVHSGAAQIDAADRRTVCLWRSRVLRFWFRSRCAAYGTVSASVAGLGPVAGRRFDRLQSLQGRADEAAGPPRLNNYLANRWIRVLATALTFEFIAATLVVVMYPYREMMWWVD